MADERVQARAIANRVLDRVNADPDDDMAILARQLLRADGRSIQAGVVIKVARQFIEAADNLEDEIRDGSEIWELPCAMSIVLRGLRQAIVDFDKD